MTKKIILLSGLFLLISLYSCNNGNKTTNNQVESKNPKIDKNLLIGSWIDTSEAALNFTILPNGEARSDNMATLLYKKWKLDGDKITFTIESIGNGTSSVDNETCKILKLNNDALILKNGELIKKYKRKK